MSMIDCMDLPSGEVVPPECRPIRRSGSGVVRPSPGRVVSHDWAHGWAGWEQVIMSQDASQSFGLTAPNDRGVVTGLAGSGGAHRVALLRQGTRWRDSEIRSVVWGPTGWNGGNAQQGHIHRLTPLGGGVWVGVAIWTAIVGGSYQLLNTRAVQFTRGGSSFTQSAGDLATASDANYIDRRAYVRAVERFNFGVWINGYLMLPPWDRIATLASGDLVTIDELTDATFNATNVALSGVNFDSGVLNVQEPDTEEAVARTAVLQGRVTPTSNEKRWCPHVMATRLVGGSSEACMVEIKRWRVEEPEPDWGNPRVLRRNIASSVNVPALPTVPGWCALWAGHFVGGSTGAWGSVEMSSLAA